MHSFECGRDFLLGSSFLQKCDLALPCVHLAEMTSEGKAFCFVCLKVNWIGLVGRNRFLHISLKTLMIP